MCIFNEIAMLLQKLFHPIVLYILLFNMGGYNTASSCTTPKTCRKQKEQSMSKTKREQRWIYGLRTGVPHGG